MIKTIHEQMELFFEYANSLPNIDNIGVFFFSDRYMVQCMKSTMRDARLKRLKIFIIEGFWTKEESNGINECVEFLELVDACNPWHAVAVVNMINPELVPTILRFGYSPIHNCDAYVKLTQKGQDALFNN